jgi:hypothetical protein
MRTVFLYKNYAFKEFIFFIKRDFLRAAAFLWIRPLEAALSNLLEASVKVVAAAVASFNTIAASTFLTDVRIADLTVMFCALFLSLILTRLIADLIFGIPFTS